MGQEEQQYGVQDARGSLTGHTSNFSLQSRRERCHLELHILQPWVTNLEDFRQQLTNFTEVQPSCLE